MELMISIKSIFTEMFTQNQNKLYPRAMQLKVEANHCLGIKHELVTHTGFYALNPRFRTNLSINIQQRISRIPLVFLMISL